MITLDGGYEEGGGQILRTALAFSIITGKSFTITNIRKQRKEPGLMNQHLGCVLAAQKVSNAKALGAQLGSNELSFTPGKMHGSRLNIDLNTAASIPLFLQSILLPLLFHQKSKITIKGGTDVGFASPYDYFTQVFLPQINRFAEIKVNLKKRGYYPKGNGEVAIEINPRFNRSEFATIQEFRDHIARNVKGYDLLQQPHLIQIKGVSHAEVGLQESRVAERQRLAAQSELSKLSCPINIQVEYANAASLGSGITLWAIYSKNKDDVDSMQPIRIGGDALGEKGVPAEKVGKLASHALTLQMESKAPIDAYLADQLLPFMAFVPSTIKAMQISKHSLSNIYVIESFMGKTFQIDEKERIIKSVF